MKKTRLKSKKGLAKKSKQPISKLQRLLWDECKRIIRTKYPPTCYTCGKSGLSGSNWHTGHLWPKASLGAFLKYDLRVLRPQCYHCNINLGGNGAVFYAKMLAENGPEYMSQLEMMKQILVKAYDHYEKLLEEYRLL